MANGKAGAPKGNQNAVKGIRMARIIEGICAEEEYRRLKLGVDKQLDKFAEGNLPAGEFVRDTVDGKPSQTVRGPGEHGEHDIRIKHSW